MPQLRGCNDLVGQRLRRLSLLHAAQGRVQCKVDGGPGGSSCGSGGSSSGSGIGGSGGGSGGSSGGSGGSIGGGSFGGSGGGSSGSIWHEEAGLRQQGEPPQDAADRRAAVCGGGGGGGGASSSVFVGGSDFVSGGGGSGGGSESSTCPAAPSGGHAGISRPLGSWVTVSPAVKNRVRSLQPGSVGGPLDPMRSVPTPSRGGDDRNHNDNNNTSDGEVIAVEPPAQYFEAPLETPTQGFVTPEAEVEEIADSDEEGGVAMEEGSDDEDSDDDGLAGTGLLETLKPEESAEDRILLEDLRAPVGERPAKPLPSAPRRHTLSQHWGQPRGGPQPEKSKRKRKEVSYGRNRLGERVRRRPPTRGSYIKCSRPLGPSSAIGTTIWSHPAPDKPTACWNHTGGMIKLAFWCQWYPEDYHWMCRYRCDGCNANYSAESVKAGQRRQESEGLEGRTRLERVP